jgi:hypothetical protein
MKVFIHFPTENLYDVVQDNAQAEELLKELRFLLYRVQYEKEAVIYYDNANKDDFLKLLDIDQMGIAKPSLIIHRLLQNGEEDNVYSPKNEYFIWDLDSKMAAPVDKNMLKNAIESLFQNKKVVFLNIINDFSCKNPINAFKDNRADDSLPQFVQIQVVTNFKDLDKWLEENHENRLYNFDDFRHIENDARYIKGKSPLLGGIGGQKIAETLLKNALCDEQGKDLYNYDAENECYIWFEDEKSMDGYHGYHLVRPTSHERDKGKNGEGKLPELAKELLKKRYE